MRRINALQTSAKRLTKVMLAAVLAVGLFPGLAFAEAAQPSGQSEPQPANSGANEGASEGTSGNPTSEPGVSLQADTDEVSIALDFSGINVSAGIGKVEVDGVPYTLSGSSITVPKPATVAEAASFVTFYTYKNAGGPNAEGNYPNGMYVWSLVYDGVNYVATRQTGLDNALQYAGCSIRVSANTSTSSGVRVVTSVSKATKSALTTSGIGGYTLKEYGTVVKWDTALGDNGLTLSNGTSRSAYVKGSADPIYKETDSVVKYTAVLTNLQGDNVKKELRMRPYMKLVDASGKECVLYGGNLVRSIGFIASQNANVFNRGTAGYRYVWSLVQTKYGHDKDGALGYQAGTLCDFVPGAFMWQNPELPWGCESVSLGIVLRALGYDVGKTEVYDSYLSHSDWDYVNAFAGDAYNCTGIGETYPPAIVDAANRYLVSHGSKARAFNLSGASFDQLLGYINQGYPVLVWTTIGMGYIGKWGMSLEGYEPYSNEHCVVMYGANGGIQVADPISGDVTRDWGSFASIYNRCGCYAVVIV